MFEGFFQQERNWKGKLREALKEYFNETELREICFDLGFDYESLHAGTGDKSKFVMELINKCNRQGRVQELISVCKAQRPNIEWSAIEKGIKKQKRFRLRSRDYPRFLINSIAVLGTGIVSFLCLSFFGILAFRQISPVFVPTPTAPIFIPSPAATIIFATATPIPTAPPTKANVPNLNNQNLAVPQVPASLSEARIWFPDIPPLNFGQQEEVDFRTLGFGPDDLAEFERMGRLESYKGTYTHPTPCNSLDGVETVFIQVFYFVDEFGAREFIDWATIDWTYPGVIQTVGVGDQSYYRVRETTTLATGNCTLKPLQFTFQESNMVYRVIIYTKDDDPRWPDQKSLERAMELSRHAEAIIP